MNLSVTKHLITFIVHTFHGVLFRWQLIDELIFLPLVIATWNKKLFLIHVKNPKKSEIAGKKWADIRTLSSFGFCFCISNENGKIRLNKTDIEFIAITCRHKRTTKTKNCHWAKKRKYIRIVTKLQTDTLCNKRHFNTVADWIFDEKLFYELLST